MPTFPINQGFNLGKASFTVGGGPKTKSYKSKETKAADLQNVLKKSKKLVRTQYQSSGKDWTKKSPGKFKLQVGKGQGSKRTGKYIDKHGRRDFSEHNIDTRGIWGEGTIEKQASHKPGGYLPPNPTKLRGQLKNSYLNAKSESTPPTMYTPFKMKAADYNNSPMQKNYGSMLGSPTKLFGGIKKLFKGATSAVSGAINKITGRAGGAEDPNAAAVEAMGQAGVQPHGDEAHTGGGAADAMAGPVSNDPRKQAGMDATAQAKMNQLAKFNQSKFGRVGGGGLGNAPGAIVNKARSGGGAFM